MKFFTAENAKEVNALEQKGARLLALQKDTNNAKADFKKTSEELFKKLFGVAIDTRPILTLSRSTVGFQVEDIECREGESNVDICVRGHLYEYLPTSSPNYSEQEAVFKLFYLIDHAKKAFKDYLVWVDELKKGLSIKEELARAQNEVKEVEEQLRDSRERIYTIIEGWIKDFYKVEVKRGSDIGYHLVSVGEVSFHVTDFAFDDTDGTIMVKGEVPGFSTPIVVPIHKFVSDITSK